jgi:hypothetical protein
VHENVKQALVAASELDTRLVMRSLRNTELLLWRQADRIGEFRRGRMLEVVGSPKPSTNPRWDPSFEVKDLLFVD